MGQFGKAKNPDGTGGTTPADVQRVIASQYINSDKAPLLRVGPITGRGDLSYAFPGGEALLPTPHGAYIRTWPAGITALVTQPGATRIDTIYVDDDGVKVQQGGSPPPGVAILDRRSLPAGATSTSSSSSVYNRYWAMPYGANLGWLAMFIDPRPQGEPVPTNRHTWTQLNFWVPNDRACQIRMHQCVYGTHTPSAPSTDFSNYGVGTMQYYAYLDDTLFRTWEMSYDRTWYAKPHFVDFEVTEGEHVLRVEREKRWGIADPLNFGSAENIWQPASVGIHDEGVRE